MPNPNPRPGRRFVKGQSGNPRGAAAHNKELKQLRRLTNDEIASVGSLIMDRNLNGLKEIVNNPDSSVLRTWMAMIAIKATQKGDAQALNVLLDRIAGKVKDSLQLTGKDGGAIDIASSVRIVNEAEVAESVKKFNTEY